MISMNLKCENNLFAKEIIVSMAIFKRYLLLHLLIHFEEIHQTCFDQNNRWFRLGQFVVENV